MINTFYLLELRETLAEKNDAELPEFSAALAAVRMAEFMEDSILGNLGSAEMYQRVEFSCYALWHCCIGYEYEPHLPYRQLGTD